MNELLIAVLSLVCGGIFGYVLHDFRRWNIEYEAWHRAQALRRQMRVVSEPPNGPWSNGRWSA